MFLSNTVVHHLSFLCRQSCFDEAVARHDGSRRIYHLSIASLRNKQEFDKYSSFMMKSPYN